ncbi:DUF1444 family protein [Corallincola holothuriorum]|uniref:DUF1444 family protein n=1 Tax=Corallincola holothuriorum TaxID=2282215 RepID=A0A368NLK4_9GAMM|nr:DUF1444 family protein [Corallincola holothuriorum]RCU51477.1 DUF1444 family protein [Corallincola holothuriorum]
MTTRVCSHCGESLDLRKVVTASSPANINCASCDSDIGVDKTHAWGFAAVGLVVAIALWLLIEKYLGYTFSVVMVAVVAWWLIAEFAYYVGLKSGVVKSTLLPQDQLTQETEEEASTPFVVPRLKNHAFVKAMDDIPQMTDEMRPISEFLFSDLWLTYAIDDGDNFIALSPALAKQHGIDLDTIKATATQNVLLYLKDIRKNEHDGFFSLSCENNMIANAVLFSPLWEQIEGEINDAVVIAIPHRDYVLYAPRNSPDAIAKLKETMQSFDYSETHALSEHLYIRDGESWAVME